MKFTVWTGDFDIEYLALINWTTDRIVPAMGCLRTTMKGQVERCQYSIHAEVHRDRNDLTFVRMFAEPIEYPTAELPVTWHVDANNMYISAQSSDGEMWLKVRIDGKGGVDPRRGGLSGCRIAPVRMNGIMRDACYLQLSESHDAIA